MRDRHSALISLVAVLALLPAAGCDEDGEPAISIADRLTSIHGYHVEFEPSRGDLTPQQRAAEADAWRALVRGKAELVAQTASTSNVYGDRTLWAPLLENDRSDVSGCRFRNDSARHLRIVLDEDEIESASVEAAFLDRLPIDAGEGYCDLGSRNLRQFTIAAANFPNGGTTGRMDRLEVILGSSNGATTTDPWEELDFATLSATGDASIGEGAAQFAFVVVEKEAGWQNNFEEVFLVTEGSYFGDLK